MQLKELKDNYIFVIFHLPPCRSKPVKASFIFGTQFNLLTAGSQRTERSLFAHVIVYK